jgi:ARC6-like, IMS domain
MIYNNSFRRPLLKSNVSYDMGSANPMLPVITAIFLFVVFVLASLWLTLRLKAPLASPQSSVIGGFPTAPALPPNSSQLNPNGNSVAGFPSASSTKSPVVSNSPFPSASSAPNSTVLDAAKARQLVESWLTYKKTIFSSPFDISALQSYIVNPGPLYSDITKPGGSIEWLRTNNYSYYYKELLILGSSEFRQFPDRAHITVQIMEDLELRTPYGIDSSKSGRKTQSWVYELKLNQGKWLVYDSRKDI